MQLLGGQVDDQQWPRQGFAPTCGLHTGVFRNGNLVSRFCVEASLQERRRSYERTIIGEISHTSNTALWLSTCILCGTCTFGIYTEVAILLGRGLRAFCWCSSASRKPNLCQIGVAPGHLNDKPGGSKYRSMEVLGPKCYTWNGFWAL